MQTLCGHVDKPLARLAHIPTQPYYQALLSMLVSTRNDEGPDRLIAIRYAGASPRATGEFRVIDKEQDMEFINLDKLTIESVRRQTGNNGKSNN